LTWFVARLVNQPIESRKIKPTQIRTEVLDSIRSILIFGIGMIVPWTMLKLNLSAFASTISTISILTEIVALILWNDIHFYAIHRLLHSQFKKTHSIHHLSVTATPFTAYSMSIWEAILLGSVMPIAMLFHHFSFVSLAFLPIWSIAINTLAHSNCNLFPNASEYSLLGVIKHHQSHHSKYHGNYSFFFTQLDRWFKTTQPIKK
jgi:sterol desaturase/sphingolipid hydroxylase (fatty acid hydroxylase superfamily)